MNEFSIGQGKQGRYSVSLFLDGVEVDDVWLKGHRGVYEIYAESFDSSSRLSNFKAKEFPRTKNLHLLNYRLLDSNVSIDVDINIGYDIFDSKKGNLDETEVKIYIIPQQMNWRNIYTINEYRNLITRKLKDAKNSEIEVYDTIKNRSYFDLEKKIILKGLPLIIELTEDFSERKISDVLKPFVDVIEIFHQDCVKNLIFIHKRNSVNSIFNFPENIKNACEQYIVYFAQFLKDLGINATSDLKEEAGKVLFSITPTDEVKKLDRIREALAVYLKLPESPIVYDDSFAAMRLQQQIENLQHSQKMAVREMQVNEKLLLAQSDMIREKNVTISQQQTVIENQNKIIEKISSNSIMMDSAENKEELEKIYDGLEAGHSKWIYEVTGIKVNFIKLISTTVKNTLGKDEKITSLGLNEED